nr:hypothetical protein [Providencia rettgeri]
MDKSRQQFEETIKKLSDQSEFESKLKRANNGLNYADVGIDLMWISWQASRESLEIELPQRKGISHNEYESGYFDGIDKCEDALIRSGVKIKNE